MKRNNHLNSEKANTTSDGQRLQVRPEAKMEVDVVKELTWHYVIEGKTLQALQGYQVRLIEDVFRLLQEARTSGAGQHGPLIPPNFLDLLKAAPDEAGKTRVVIDVLATMGEDQVINIHRAVSEVAWTFA